MSRSKVINDRLKSRELFRKISAVIIIIIMVTYLSWRLTIFSENWIFSLVFYLSEILSFILLIALICSSWNYCHRESKQPLPNQKVDVFLPIYNEPLAMVRQTIRAAQKIRYPHTTYVLDDGKRDELEAVAKEFGVQYIRRPDNKGAKAGNMNHALKYATGDLIFVFDADHAAQTESIDAVLGFFEDEKVGMVITPQEYYNLNGLQYMHHGKGRLWHDQSRFYNVVQSCKDSNNCATSCGTGVMYRRSAIDEIGGFAEQTITEDMHVTLLMHNQGYRTVYFNEPIAYGVAPADLADYYRTRERWAHGNLLVLAIEKPWKSKNLTLKQRLSYIDLGIIYLECWQQLLIFMIPVLSLFFAWQPFEITPLNVMIVLGLPLLMIFIQDEQGCGMSRNWTSQLFAIARMPVQIVSWSALFGRKLSWKVSKKNLDGVFDWRLVTPQITLTLISLAALIYGIIKIPDFTGTGPISGIAVAAWHNLVNNADYPLFFHINSWHEVLPQGHSWDLLIISAFWVIYNGSRAVYWLIDTYRRTKNTHEFYRFEIPLLIQDDEGQLSKLDWISETEFKVNQSVKLPSIGEEISFSLWLPAGPMKSKAIVKHVNKNSYTADFLWDGNAERDKLCDALLSVDWHAEIHEREGYFPTLIEQFTRFLRLKSRPKPWKWSPVLMHHQNDNHLSLALVGARKGESPSQLLGFGENPIHEMVSVISPDGETTRFLVGEPLEQQGWCKLGLDGCTRWKFSVSPVFEPYAPA
ncbi:MAG: glycosyltransferase [Akkermansiaceae bacterium]|jgi:cellulose synthase/poly-beta-1,6-N-acetylglucosamine synthase-like glycosyltransferase|nr:glycosyltransferase [Luteolibacter sp.]